MNDLGRTLIGFGIVAIIAGAIMYAGHVPVLGGVSPLRPRKTGPLSEDKGVTARWGLKEVLATATT